MIQENAIQQARILKNYSDKVFQQLSDFHIARDQINAYEDRIIQLGDVICKYHMNDILGINLLHKHFDINKDEKIVRQFINSSLAYMKPLNRNYNPSRCIPYLWAYSNTDEQGEGWYPVEFIEWDDEVCCDYQILNYTDELLKELGSLLTCNNMQNVFGISALYAKNRFKIEKGETLVETTDEINRVLTLKTDTIDNVKSMNNTTKTLWVFTSHELPQIA